MAQVEAGTLSFSSGEFDLAQLAREAVEAARPRAATAGVDLGLEVRGVVPRARVDGDRIGQMLDNLIVNAIKFTPPGGAVAVRLQAAGGVAELEVSDTGVGIAADDVAQLFDRFFRAREAGEHGVPGVGLGLTIVRAIVEGHGGQITADSTPGVGTTFRVRLPLAGADGTGVSGSIARSRAAATPED